MKSLGIPQPGAWLVINDYYTTVPLPEPTDYRGTILIYALPNVVSAAAFEQFLAGCHQLRVTSHPRMMDFELGGFVGTAELVGCEISDSEQAVAVVESATELGFVASDGGFGLFDVEHDPFAVSALPRVSYRPYTFSPTGRRKSAHHEPASEPTEKSLGRHFSDGFEQQARRELEKNLKGLGRDVAKDAISYGADALMGWLGGGGKPKGGGGKRKK